MKKIPPDMPFVPPGTLRSVREAYPALPLQVAQAMNAGDCEIARLTRELAVLNRALLNCVTSYDSAEVCRLECGPYATADELQKQCAEWIADARSELDKEQEVRDERA